MRIAKSAALMVAAAIAAGCVPVAGNTRAEEERIASIQEEVQRLKRDVTELRAGSGGVAPAGQESGKKLAELDERVRQLDTDAQALKGKIEEIERALSETRRGKADPTAEKLQSDLGALSARVDSLADKVAALPRGGDAKASPASPAAPSKSPKELYDEAYALYRENKYADAQTKFREYAERYPDTPLTDNAIFWIGEAFYDQAQYEQAIIQYDKVIQKYPDGDKVASSLLKQAFSFAAMGDVVSARILLKKVMAEHPGSEQASIAKKKLDVLGE